jgi:acetyltransferase-like isoleucine patch superfamily enzyme
VIPREYVINEVASRIPLTNLRVRAYAALGVRFEDWATSNVMLHTEVHAPREIRVGANTIIGRHCLLDGRGGLEIGRNVNITSHALLITAGHDPRSPRFEGFQAPVRIGDRAWLASGVTVLPGVTIGEGAVIGAGSVVTRDVPEYTIAVGSPAKPVSDRPRELTYELGYRRDWV